MSYGATVLKQCENLQGMLDDHFQTCNASELIEPTPLLDFLLSPMNMDRITPVVAPGNSKVRNVVLEYFQRINEDNVDEDQANPNCVATDKRGSCSESYTIDTDENLQVTEKITAKDLQTHCQDDGEYLRGVIQRLVDVMVRKVATQTAEQAAALTGKWGADANSIDGVTVNAQDQLVLETKLTGTENVFPWTFEALDAAVLETGYCMSPIIFSDYPLWQYGRRAEKGCCADQGVNIGELTAQFGKAVLHDRRIKGAFGVNEFLVTQPGAMALIQFSANEFWNQDAVRQLMMTSTLSNKQVIFDPRSGLKMDLNVGEIVCGDIDIVLTATTKLVALPTDIFGTGDDKDGVRYINGGLVSNS